MNQETIILTAKVVVLLAKSPIKLNAFTKDMIVKTNLVDEEKFNSFANTVYKIYSLAMAEDYENKQAYTNCLLTYASGLKNYENLDQSFRDSISTLASSTKM